MRVPTLLAALVLPTLAAAQAPAEGLNEAQANLKWANVLERAYYQEKDALSALVATQLGFCPERGNRYSYYFAETGPAQARTGPTLAPDAGDVIIAVDQHAYPQARFPKTVAETGCPITGTARAKGQVGITGEAPHQEFLILAAGNLDGDDTLDCWTVASFDRIDSRGMAVASGVPFHEQSDLSPADEAAAAVAGRRAAEERQRQLEIHQLTAVGITDPKAQEVIITLLKLAPEVGRYHQTKGVHPPDFATLAAFAKVSPKDPWGHPYLLVPMTFPQVSLWEIVGLSAGPDGKVGTADDLALPINAAAGPPPPAGGD